MDFKEALTYINLGNCILFTGSGFSKGATNSKGTTMPTGLGLAEILYNECDETSMVATYKMPLICTLVLLELAHLFDALRSYLQLRIPIT